MLRGNLIPSKHFEDGITKMIDFLVVKMFVFFFLREVFSTRQWAFQWKQTVLLFLLLVTSSYIDTKQILVSLCSWQERVCSFYVQVHRW